MTKSLVRRLCAAVLFLMLVAGAVHAQQEAPAGEAATAAPPKESKVTLFQLWKTGGWAMYPIGLLSVRQ